MRASIAGSAPLALALIFAACDEGGGIGSVDERAFFEPGAIDFGTVRVDDGATLTVRLVTAGIGDARVEDVRYEPASDAFSVRAGGAVLRGAFLPEGGSELTVFYGPITPGDHSTTLVVRAGGVEARLAIAAVARDRRPASMDVSPESIDFGDVERGRDAVRRFTLANTGEDPGVLREVRPKSAGGAAPFSVTAAGGGSPIATEIPGGGSVELEAHFLPLALGAFTDDLELVFDDGVTAALGVRGSGAPAGTLSCDPTAIDFGPVGRGEVRERNVRCSVSGGAFSIARIAPASTSSELFSVPDPPTELAPGGTLDLRVVFDARGVVSDHAGTIEIASLHGAVVRIDVRGQVVAPPPGATDVSVTLTWSTDQTDFDLHLVREGGAPFQGNDDCYYASKNPDWGTRGDSTDDPYLDRDETEGRGPEQINLESAVERSFDVYVHFYNYGSPSPPPTEISVEVSVRGVPAGTFRQTLQFCGSTWHVGQFDFSADPPAFTADTTITNAYRSRASARCQ